jgi:proteasome lid subunit RPN8/RPN11
MPTSDPIAESLRAGQLVVAAQPIVATTTTAAVTTSAPPPTAAASASPATRVVSASRPVPALRAGPPPGSVTVAAIGDSVMLGAASRLQQRLGATGYIDADVSRHFAQGIDVARRMREEGRLGEVVIVHLGTNGPPKASEVDAMMRELAGVPHVLVVTCRMPRSWETETNNTLRAAASRHPTITIVDWHDFSDSHSDWFESDGVHLKPRGAQAYADLLGSALPPPPPPPTTTTEPPPPTTAPSTTTTEPAPTSSTVLPMPNSTTSTAGPPAAR